jgi:guanine deaminase
MYFSLDPFATSLGGSAKITIDTMINENDKALMREAIKLMRKAVVVNETARPFGAVIAKDGKIIASSGTSVAEDNDPTGHAEVNAIRKACKVLGTWDLSGCVMYTSCQCCPMCYSTAYWARLKAIYYGSPKEDLQKPIEKSSVPQVELLREEAAEVWGEFRKLSDGE